jgi:hypothetical protein
MVVKSTIVNHYFYSVQNNWVSVLWKLAAACPIFEAEKDVSQLSRQIQGE